MGDKIKRYQHETVADELGLRGILTEWDRGDLCKWEDVKTLEADNKTLRSKLETVQACEACGELEQVRAERDQATAANAANGLRVIELEAERDKATGMLDLMNRAKELNRMMLVAATEEVLELKDERDELLAMLKAVIDRGCRLQSVVELEDAEYVAVPHPETMDEVRALIAKCEEGKGWVRHT